jgi:hypothetical protein
VLWTDEQKKLELATLEIFVFRKPDLVWKLLMSRAIEKSVDGKASVYLVDDTRPGVPDEDRDSRRRFNRRPYTPLER